MYDRFRPGKVWYDTEGKRIQAHGGSLLYADNTYYWYGENKEGIYGRAHGEPPCPFWHRGVRLYSSADLYNWKDEGVIMYEERDERSPFYPAHIMDRPHIVFNDRTGLFVLWAKTARGGFEGAAFSVCISEDIRGPFRFVHEVTAPPYHAGDFDLVKEEERCYILYENPHTCMVCQTLTDDFTGLTDEVSEHLHAKCPPYVREAPAFFRRGGRNFLLTSGTTGYFPNPSRFDEILSFHGEWRELGNACLHDVQNNSFHAQFSSVFRHPFRKDLYIALGDRWLTDLPPDLPDMERAFLGLFDPSAGKTVTDEQLRTFTDDNTGEADYVWLPVLFGKDGTPFIEWKTEWRAEDFAPVSSPADIKI